MAAADDVTLTDHQRLAAASSDSAPPEGEFSGSAYSVGGGGRGGGRGGVTSPGGVASDQPGGGSHGVLCAEVDIVLLLPVDPVGARALPVRRTRRHGGQVTVTTRPLLYLCLLPLFLPSSPTSPS